MPRKRPALTVVAFALLLAGAAFGLRATPGVSAQPAATAARWQAAWISTYTWYSNSPPGCGIEYARDYGYPTVHDCAGGTGTWRDPITFASQLGEWVPGTRVYIPFFRAYFMKEDYCSTCFRRVLQMDVWAGKAPAGSAIADFWHRLRVEVNPPRGLPTTSRRGLTGWSPTAGRPQGR